MCAAPRREPHFENGPPSIRVTVAQLDHKWRGNLRRNARAALATALDPCNCCALLSFRIINGEEVSGETPGPPYRHVWWCDREELSIRRRDGGVGARKCDTNTIRARRFGKREGEKEKVWEEEQDEESS